MHRLRRRLGAVAMAVGVAALTPVGAPALASSQHETVSTIGVFFSSNAITCPTATICLAGGSNTSDVAAIVVINGSNGAATLGGTDASMTTVGGIACATATHCVAVGDVGDAVSVNGSNGATGTNHAITSEPIPIFYAVACPAATTCYGGGTHLVSYPNFETTLTPLSPAGVPGATTTGPAGQVQSLVCVTASRCYAAIAGSGGGKGAIEVINNGAAGKSFPLPFGGFAIACYQAASCEVAGSNGTAAEAATVNPVTGNPGTAHAISGMTQAGGLACATSTTCFIVGTRRGASTSVSAVSDVANGLPQPATKAPGIGLSGVACSTATTCWAIGQNGKGGIVIPV